MRFFAEIERIDFVLRDFQYLEELVFHRQAVTIPARHIGRIKSLHRFIFDDDVFEDFVQCVADMNIAVRVRRAVMKNEFLSAFGGPADTGVDIPLLPFFKLEGFPVRQIGLHRKIRRRQVDRILIVHKLLQTQRQPHKRRYEKYLQEINTQ